MHEDVAILDETARAGILQHLLMLDADDRYARFGSLLRDDGIHALVGRLDFERDLLLGIMKSGRLAGFAHVSRSKGALAELALSVVPCWRQQGVARTLFDCAAQRAAGRGIAGFACVYGHPATLRIANELGLAISFQTIDPRAIVHLRHTRGGLRGLVNYL